MTRIRWKVHSIWNAYVPVYTRTCATRRPPKGSIIGKHIFHLSITLEETKIPEFGCALCSPKVARRIHKYVYMDPSAHLPVAIEQMEFITPMGVLFHQARRWDLVGWFGVLCVCVCEPSVPVIFYQSSNHYTLHGIWHGHGNCISCTPMRQSKCPSWAFFVFSKLNQNDNDRLYVSDVVSFYLCLDMSFIDSVMILVKWSEVKTVSMGWAVNSLRIHNS